MTAKSVLFKGRPALSAIVANIDNFLQTSFPDFFGSNPLHPYLPIRRTKVVHDNVWGTNQFTWRELILMDSPVIQRLRDIHQVGLGFHVYPSARHARFEHCLGVVTIAARVFDAILQRSEGELENILKILDAKTPPRDAIARLRQELRLAALLHDTGHSLFSHTSELVYSRLDLLKRAAAEMKVITGKEKGSGEIISFCIACTDSVAALLDRAKGLLIGDTSSGEYDGDVDMLNVSLMIVGRTRHPYLQFLGDIISSGFDADKLDYLIRDAKAAGLPLSYDVDRYLYAVRLEKDRIDDDENQLKELYSMASDTVVERRPPSGSARYPNYETYRLRLPQKAINAVEQIIICKMMLFGYLYHHPKVRAAEGLLQRLLIELVRTWKQENIPDEEILVRFLRFTDSNLSSPEFLESPCKAVRDYAYRIKNRLLPREVYRFGGGTTSHAEGELLADFLTDLRDPDLVDEFAQRLEKSIGENLIKIKQDLGSEWNVALLNAGVWLDIPKQPKFEDINTVISGSDSASESVLIGQVFPITQWTQAYTAFRHYVRIFAFSEYSDATAAAAKAAMQEVVGIKGDQFYREARRNRT